jgi:hypothetical protein
LADRWAVHNILFHAIIIIIIIIIKSFLLKDYCLIVVRISAHPDSPESYAGRSLNSWQGHPSQTGQRLGVRQDVVPGAPGWVLDWFCENRLVPPNKRHTYLNTSQNE